MITVLIVDDDRIILELCTLVLTETCGVNVLQADDGNQAVDVADGHPGPIDLLLSDIVMGGGRNGIELAKILTRSRPEMKVILMSGFNHEGWVFDPGWHFIGKPFRPADLCSKIAEALGRPPLRKAGSTSSGPPGRAAA